MNKIALHTLMQWFSPSYPVGAFSYSHGLEWAISEGIIHDVCSLQNWLKEIVQFGAGRNDAILLAHAYRASDQTALVDIAEWARAFASSVERLHETNLQGAAFVRTTNAVWADTLPDLPYPVAVGAAARHQDLPLEETATLYLHAFAANLISAAVRFMPLGQTDGQRILAGLLETIDTVAMHALPAALDDMGGCVWQADMTAMQHETLTTRIFRS